MGPSLRTRYTKWTPTSVNLRVNQPDGFYRMNVSTVNEYHQPTNESTLSWPHRVKRRWPKWHPEPKEYDTTDPCKVRLVRVTCSSNDSETNVTNGYWVVGFIQYSGSDLSHTPPDIFRTYGFPHQFSLGSNIIRWCLGIGRNFYRSIGTHRVFVYPGNGSCGSIVSRSYLPTSRMLLVRYVPWSHYWTHLTITSWSTLLSLGLCFILVVWVPWDIEST